MRKNIGYRASLRKISPVRWIKGLLSDLVEPLTTRERLIIAIALFFVLTILLNPYAKANNENIGRLFLIPAAACSADEGWQNPNLASGLPQTDGTYSDDGEAEIIYGGATSAVASSSKSPLICSGFDKRNSFSAHKYALHINYKVQAQEVSQYDPLNDPLKTEQEIFTRQAELASAAAENSIDTVIKIELSFDRGKTYDTFHAHKNQSGELILAIPPIYNTQINEMRVALSQNSFGSESALFIESVGVSYEVAGEKDISASLERSDPNLVVNKSLKFTVKSKEASDGIWQGLVSQFDSEAKKLNAAAKLFDTSSNFIADLPVSSIYLDTSLQNEEIFKIEVDKIPSSLKPGQYVLELTLEDENGATTTHTQNFTWGVLASNLTRSVFTPEQSSQLQITVLDESGKTICDSSISIDISKNGEVLETISTDSEIMTGEKCQDYGDHIEPDYFTELSGLAEGDYELKITADNPNGSYTAYDNFSVVSSPEFTIERISTTRVYPVVEYAMNITLAAKEEGLYTIKDYVPKSFKITQPQDAVEFSESISGEQKILEWQVYLGQEPAQLSYIFDAPDVSPAFYTLGNLSIESEQITHQEPRLWQLAGDAVSHMILLFDGATVPTDWTCISCNPGEDFYQTFIRGNSSYGTIGGSATHNHTGSGTLQATTAATTTENQAGSVIADLGHTHSFTPAFSASSNLPSYRSLKVIRYDIAGSPATLPAGVIAFFDDTLPSGWTQYSAQDGFYIRGDGSVNSGGSNSHSNNVTATSATTTAIYGVRNGGQRAIAADSTHTHDVSTATDLVNHEPPYIETIMASLDSAAAPPAGMIAMWDDTQPGGWLPSSNSGDPFFEKFIKASSTYGATGGSVTHTHADINGTTTAASTSSEARAGTAGIEAGHTHPFSVSSISSESNLPPYRDVIFAEKAAGSTFEQSAYRFYENSNSTDVGAPLAAQDTAGSLANKGDVFRLRMAVHIANNDLSSSGQSFKLQYSPMSGSCDTSFNGENYVDVETNTGAIRYYNNPSPSDDSALTTNANDPVHSGHSMIPQTYQEINGFTNLNAVTAGQDAYWDFALFDHSAPGLESYCFRAVKADGSDLEIYSSVAQITVADTPSQMLLLYDGATVPSGWSCISCAPGEDAYQRFIRGAGTYGSTGGAVSHSHTASSAVQATADVLDGNADPGTGTNDNTHGHSLAAVFSNASNLPQYRTLKVIRYDNGVPSTIPAGAIALFSGAVPAGWTQYSAQDGNYVYGESTAGSSGGSNTHGHTISGTTSAASGGDLAPRTGNNTSVASNTHTHTVSGSSDTQNNEPPYIEAILAQADSDASLPNNFIAFWNKPAPGGWNCISCNSGDAFYQRFFKAAASYGATGGSVSHNHADQTIASSGPDTNVSSRNGNVQSSGTHTHQVQVSGYSSESNLPPYLDVIVASRGVNTAPDTPANLGQERTSGGSAISIGGWANETQVTFTADVSDADNPENLSLCVEVKALGTGFTNSENVCGSAVSYSGTAVSAQVTATGLTDTQEYHWQARTKDASGAYSAWVSYGGNAESARDFAVDATEPTGTVYDGPTGGIDIDFNGGSLSELSANWNVDATISGLASSEYSIGTSPGNFDVHPWTNTAGTSFTESALNLNTSQLYYANVRVTDNAGNVATLSSDGIYVSPTLSFSTSTSAITFNNLNQSNSLTDTQSTDLTTTTNALNGYEIKAYLNTLPSTIAGDTIALFSGGSYASPAEWTAGMYGYGYHSSDTNVDGLNRFNGSPCPGGGNAPCYAPFSLTPPGDVIADNTDITAGAPIINETFTITHRVSVTDSQAAGDYQTTLIYTVTARY